MSFHAPERYRKIHPQLGMGHGNNGWFIVSYPGKPTLQCIASDGEGWDHVSVSRPDRCPTWDEMCFIKDLFWDEEDCVVQYHPPHSQYVNNNKYCLHLWRPTDCGEMPFPKIWMV